MRLLPLVVLFASSRLPSAFAQARDASTDRVAAEALFRAGRDALRKGNVELACTRFADSHRIDPLAVGPLLNLAECDERRGGLTAARDKLRRAIERMQAGDPRLTLAEARAGDLDLRIPRVIGTLASDAPSNTTISLDDTAVDHASGAEWALDPGSHEFVVRAPGRVENRITVTLAERQTVRVTLTPGEPTLASSTTTPQTGATARVTLAPPPVRQSTRRTIGFVVGGAGIVSLGIGAVTGWMALDRASTFRDHCDATGCDDTGLAAAQSGRQLDVLSAVTLGVGAVALVTGIYLIVTAPRSTASTRGPAGFAGTF